MMQKTIANEMYNLCDELFPIARSLTGDGFRESLDIIRRIIPDMKVYEVPTGTQCFDWTVPREWVIREAYIDYICDDGSKERILDFKDCNLVVVGYSTPVDKIVDLSELRELIYTKPELPDAIPYITSYYKERFGFCTSKKQFDSLRDGRYHIYIDSELKEGSLTYGELIIPGETDEEILITSYLCHPSMANNELSGPVVLAYLAKWISEQKKRRYTYRFVINPETIGAICYISRNIETLKANVKAGYVLSCVGDDRTYSHIESKYGNTLADRALDAVLRYQYPEYKTYSFLHRGSDERQYNAPGVDMPVCGFCRSKYHEYPEYHTSLDNMSLISPEGLYGAYDVMTKVISALEINDRYIVKCLCEPQLGKRGLYPTVSNGPAHDKVAALVDFIAYADGRNDVFEISEIIGQPVTELIEVVQKLLDNDLLEKDV